MPKKPDSKPKVLIIGPAWPLRGGLSTYNQILARAFADQGNEVRILTFRLQYPSFLFPGKTQFSEDPAPENLIIDVALNSVNPFNWIRTGWKYRKYLPDLVVVRYWLPFMGPCLGTVARIIKGNGKTRIVAITDNIIPHEKRIGDRWFTSYFLGGCHGFVAMSKKVLEDLKLFETRKPALYNPHPLYDSFQQAVSKTEACAKLNLDPNARYLLFFGFIRAYKGLDLLLEAFARTPYKSLNLKLLVAGEFYEPEQPYKDLVHKLKLDQDVVFFSNFIPDQEVHLYFSVSDMVVQPYKDATQSGVTQVAYFYNKPMIVTRVGGLPELVPDGKAGFVTDQNPESVAGAIGKFYANGVATDMEAFIREEKKKFSWEQMTDSLWKASGTDK